MFGAIFKTLFIGSDSDPISKAMERARENPDGSSSFRADGKCTCASCKKKWSVAEQLRDSGII